MGNDPPQHGRIVVIVMAILMVGGAVSLTYFMHVSSTELVRNLNSNDPEKVGDSLSLLKDRRDPAGIERAKALLKSGDVDVWANAALYLGAMGKSESIPYLVNALRISDAQEGHEISIDLTTMTGRDFGTRYEDWNAWWLRTNAGNQR